VSGPSNATSFALNSDGSFSYTPNANFNGSDSFQYKANDGSLDSNTVTVTITVNAVNDAPVNSMPAPPAFSQDTTLTMSGAGAIQISDVDAGTNPVQVSLSATNGTMSLSGTAGLSFSAGDGTGDASMTFTGSISDINSALNGMTFVPAPGYFGPASIQIVTNDQGFTGSGGPLSDTDTLSITVQQNDQPPVNTVPGPQSVGEDTALVFSTGNGNAISVSDPDSNPVKVTLTVTHGTLTLSGTAGLSFITGDGTSDATMTFTGTIANINSALNGLSYTGNSDFSGSDVLTITTNDQESVIPGGPLSDTDTVNITVNPVDDAPVAVADSYTVFKYTATSNTSLTVNAASGVLANDTDVDTPHSSLTAILVTGPAHAQSFVLNSDGSFTYVPATGYAGPDSFSYKANDGTLDSNTVSASITVLNHAPSGSPDSYTGVGNTALDVASPANPPNDTTPSVHLAGNLLANDTDADGDTLSAVPETVASTAGGSATISANGSFTYSPVANAASDTFTYHVTDGTDTVAATVTITLNNKVWYVKNDVAGSGTGTSTDPFKTLASAATASAPGEFLYVFLGDGTTANMNAGVTLQNNQSLIGAGADLVVNANTLVTAGATRPRITNTAGNAADTANGNTVKGVILTGASFGLSASSSNGLTVDRVAFENNTVGGLVLSTTSGTITVTNTTMSGNPNALSVAGGTSTINIDNTNSITNSSNTSVAISSRPAAAGNISIGATINDTGRISITNNVSGTISFTGAQTLSTGINDAVTLSNNAGATINFSGALGVTTTVGGALIATGGGTLNVTGTANVTTGPANAGVNINGVTIGASGITFTSVTTSGAGSGVSLASLGIGNVAINGGTIDGGATGISLNLLGASTVSLSGLSIGSTTPPATGIGGSSFGTLSIGSGVNVSGATALSLNSGTLTGTFNSVSSTGGTNGVTLTGVTGSWGATGGALTGASGATFNVSGGGAGAISFGAAISQSNAANAVTIAGGNTNTINFNGNVSASGSSTGVSMSGSSGNYNFNGTSSFAGINGILISNGESGTITFSSNTSNTSIGDAFQVDGSVTPVTAAISYSGTMSKASAGRFIDVNRLNAPGTLTMTHSPAAPGNLTLNSTFGAGISITNSSGTIAIFNASVTHGSSQAGVTLSGNTGASITLNGLAVTSNGNKASMLISGGGTVTVGTGAAASSLNGSGGTARVIDGTTVTFTGTLSLNGAGITGNASADAVTLGGGTLAGVGSTITAANRGLVLSAVTLAAGAGMTSISSSGGANGISLTNVTGGTLVSPYTVGGGSLSGHTGSTFLVSGGSAVFTFNGTASQTNAQRVVNISGVTSGAITLGGNVTGSALCTGVTIGGTGGTVTMSGTISLNGANDTFTASDSGGLTLVVNGSSNAIGNSVAPAGPAVSISNVAIGAAGVAFQRVSANGGVNAIVLNNTGASGHFAITGDGTNVNNASGGTMQNQTGDAVLLTSTRGPIFNQVSIQSSTHNGIKGTGVTDFTLTNSTVNNSGLTSGGVIAGTVDDSNLNFGTHAAGTENNLSGVVTITGNTLTNAYYNGVYIHNFAGTISNAAISSNTITSSTVTANSQGSGIEWIAFGSAGGVASITKATLSSNNIQHFPSQAGINLQCGNSTSSGAPAGTYGDFTDATNTNAIRITNNTITGGAVQMNTDAILATIGGTGNGNFLIDSNGSVATPLGNTNGHVIAVQIGGTGQLRATVTNNRIVANNIVGSRGIVVTETNQFATSDAPALLAFVTGNVVSATDGCGIFLESARSGGTMKATVTGNTVGKETQTVAEGAIQVWSGDSSASTNVHTTVCLTINGNTATGGSNSTATQTAPGIGIRLQANSVPSSNTFVFNINGLSPGNATVAQMESYVGSQNPGSNCGTFGTCNGGGAYGVTNVNGYGNACTGGF